MTAYTSKEQLVEALKKQIANSDNQALKALKTIYANQTYDEKRDQATEHNNGIGFSGKDAKILSSFAQQLEYKGSLSSKQMAIVKRIMPRYARQLISQSIETSKIKKAGKNYIW